METYLSRKEMIENIQKVETDHDLLQYKVDGWCVWPLLRFSVGRALQNLPLDETKKVFSKKELFAFAVKDVFKLPFLKKARFLAKTLSSNRRELEDGKWKDIFLDDLLAEVGAFFKLESVNEKTYLPRAESAFIRNNLTTVIFEILSRQLSKLNIPPTILSIAGRMEKSLREGFEIGAFTSCLITRRILEFYWLKKLYGLLLKRIQPEFIFATNMGEPAVAAAARERGIRVINFQHGYLDQLHLSYSWGPYALIHKSAMPIPSAIFLYGEYWKQELLATGFWKSEDLFVIGSLRMDRYATEKKMKETDICNILVTTQGTDTQRLVNFMSEFLKLAEGRLRFRLNFKFHPIYDNSRKLYEEAFGGNKHVSLITSEAVPTTFELLNQTHIHISISSTCHYEALSLGVPSVILPLKTHEIVLPLHKTGHALLAKAPQDLVDIVLKWRSYKIPPEVGSQYFRPNALENIKKELKL